MPYPMSTLGSRALHPRLLRPSVLGLCAAVMVGATGCGSLVEKATEKAVEKGVEHATGIDDLNIDEDSGTISFSKDGESVVVSGEEGQFELRTDEGTYRAGDASLLPDFFPQWLLVDGVEINTVSTVTDADNDGAIVSLVPGGDVEQILENMVNVAISNGFTVESTLDMSSDTDFFSTTSLRNGSTVLSVQAMGKRDDPMLSVSYFEEAS